MMVGWAEWVALPDFGIGGLRAKIDTGAKTSSLHAENIVVSDGDVCFTTSPDPANPDRTLDCRARIIDQRQITNSGGQSDMRYVIQTQLVIGDMKRTIDVTAPACGFECCSDARPLCQV